MSLNHSYLITASGQVLSAVSDVRFPPQDFRDAVDKAARQNGKAVIEERTLDQILYYLPQLYELNRGLLQELRNRLDKW